MGEERLPPHQDDICQLCGTEKVYWHDALLCVVCDNRDDGEATWFDDMAENTS
jgi:hypothetical protein